MLRRKSLAIILVIVTIISSMPVMSFASDDEIILYIMDDLSFETCRAMGIGKIGGSESDALARQPEAARAISENAAKMCNYINQSVSKISCIAIGMVGGNLMDAIARQPEAGGMLSANANRLAQTILAEGKKGDTEALALTLGKTGAGMMDAIARQPEASYKIESAEAMITQECKGYIFDYALGFGKIGGSMMDAIARQPEASDKIIEQARTSIRALKAEHAGSNSKNNGGYSGGGSSTPSNTTNTVKFDVQGVGREIANLEVESGKTISYLPGRTAYGYDFLGWYKEPECINKWNVTKDVVSKDTTLYAKWSEPYIKFKVKKASNDNYIKLKWNYVSGAPQYAIFANVSGKKLKRLGAIKENNIKIKKIAGKKIKAGKKYTFRVAIRLGEKIVKSNLIDIKTFK